MLDSWSFFRLVFRLPAYMGVLAARVSAEQDDDSGQPAGPYREPVHEVPATRAALEAEPAFTGIFSFGGGVTGG